jgi:hypothetical protein
LLGVRLQRCSHRRTHETDGPERIFQEFHDRARYIDKSIVP